MPESRRLGRRPVLAGTAAALAGCARLQNAAGRAERAPVSLTIKTTPADADPYGIRIARHLSQHLEAVGVRTEIAPMATEELLRSVLIGHEFDLYVARHPGRRDPDFLRGFAHSRYGDAPGWHNPFGFGDLEVDDLLDRQRYEGGDRRRSTVEDLQWELARNVPFAAVARPDALHAARTDRAVDWPGDGFQSAADLLAVTPREDARLDHLRVTVTDPRPTTNRNPLAVEYRNRGVVTGLVYEPLARREGDLQPRLADDWTLDEREDGSVARVSLREAVWHDGEPVTADDVAFTYRFVADTSLGEAEVPVPAPRFRGRSSLVDSVAVVDDRTVEFRFDASPSVGVRAFTVPVLPRHEWADRTGDAGVAGVFGETTEALTWANPRPVGSGPLAFDGATEDESLSFVRFEDHFGAESLGYERLSFRVAPSEAAAVELVVAGDADATGPLSAPVVPRVVRADATTLLAGQTPSFYHVGFDVRSPPLTNPQFRLAVAGLLDRDRLLEETFDGFATAAVSPLSGDWLAPGLAWDGRSPVAPFPGEGGDLDAAAARERFAEAGYEFRDDGTMVMAE